MMGLEQIIEANEDPTAYAKSELSDGQQRRNDSPPNAYWSDVPVVEAQNIAEMQLSPRQISAIAADRVDGPNVQHDRQGIAWKRHTPIYFDAVKLHLTLEDIASEAVRRAQKLQLAIRAVQSVQSQSEFRLAVASLGEIVSDVLNSDDADHIKAHMLINELASTIDVIAPEPRGYVPHFGLNHAMHPVKKLVAELKSAFKRTGK